MSCFFCAREGETSPERTYDKPNAVNASHLCKILDLDRHSKEFETNFQKCSFCAECMSKIQKAQYNLQQLEYFKREISSAKQEFSNFLRQSYLNSLLPNRTLKVSSDGQDLNEAVRQARRHEEFSDDFRGKIVEALRIVIKLEARDMSVSAFDTQIVHGFQIVGHDDDESVQDDSLHMLPDGDDDDGDNEIAFHFVPVQEMIVSENEKYVPTQHYVEDVLEDHTYDKIKTKDLSIRLNRLSPTFIESVTKKRGSFRKSFNRRNRDERLKCSFPNCLVTFNNSSARNTHMKLYHRKGKSKDTTTADPSVDLSDDSQPTVNKGTQFSCTFDGCVATFSTEAKRVLHVKRNHEGKFSPTSTKVSKFRCEEEGCDLVFRDAFSRDAHVKKKHLGLVNPYECKYCQAAIRTRDLLYEHIKTNHPNYDARDWSCKLCKEQFENRANLDDHMKKSHPESKLSIPSWPCLICSADFRTRDERALHLKQAHPGKRNRNSDGTRMKMDNTGDVLCPDCGKRFLTKKQFNDHYKYHGEKNFQCDQCKKKFVRAFDLRRHQASHSEEKNSICETCGKCFKDAGTLLYHHAKTCGPKADNRPEFQCTECDAVYKNKKSLNLHLLEHQGLLEKPYKCDLCDYAVRWPGILKYHRKKHFPQQEFVCDLCPSKFKHKNSLNLHRDVRHFGKRGKICTFEGCDYVGMDKQSLAVHVRMKHTKERPFSCTHCGVSFMKNSHKNRHELIHIRAGGDAKRTKTKPAILTKRVKLVEVANKVEGFQITNLDNEVSTEAIEFVHPENVVEFYEVVI